MLTSTPGPNPHRHMIINNYCWTDQHQRDGIIESVDRKGLANERNGNFAQNAINAAGLLASNAGGHHGNNLGASGMGVPGYATSLSNHQHSIQREKRGCACKNSKCLKLYCECFSRGEYCGINCHCANCKNNGENEHIRAETISQILEKNPDAFRAKITANKNQGHLAQNSQMSQGGISVGAISAAPMNNILQEQRPNQPSINGDSNS